MDAVYVHDPAALAVVLWPSLFTWRPGQIRVLTESVARGMSVMDTQLKRWNRPHSWTDRPKVQVLDWREDARLQHSSPSI